MTRIIGSLLIPVLALLAACAANPASGAAHNLDDVVASEGISPARAALLIVRIEDGESWYANGERVDRRFSPASTSKIPHLLIAIETGAVSGPQDWFEWDGQTRFLDSWNESQTFADAFRRSTVWIFQTVTPRIGSQALQDWLQDLGYGNGETGPADKVSEYWLTGPLAISASEQVTFLSRLARHTLPLSARTYELAGPVMIEEAGEGWTLSAKTGWFSSDSEQDIGWYVGWLEQQTGDRPGTYVFAFNMDMDDPETGLPARKAVVRAALDQIGALDAGT